MQIYHDIGALATIEPGETAYWWYSFGSLSKEGERPGDVGMTYALPQWPKWPEYLGRYPFK